MRPGYGVDVVHGGDDRQTVADADLPVRAAIALEFLCECHMCSPDILGWSVILCRDNRKDYGCEHVPRRRCPP